MSKEAHLNGKYAVLAAIIGILGAFGVAFYEKGGPISTPEIDNQKEIEIKRDADLLFSEYIGLWENKDLVNLKSLLDNSFYYTDELSNKRQYRNAFITEKRELFKKHPWISLKYNQKEIRIVDVNLRRGIIRYYQYYDTCTYESGGFNELHFKWCKGRYKITKEDFRADYRNPKKCK